MVMVFSLGLGSLFFVFLFFCFFCFLFFLTERLKKSK